MKFQMKIAPIRPSPIQALATPKKPPVPKSPDELIHYGFHAVRALYKYRREEIIRAYCTEERVDEMGDVLKWCANHKKAYHIVSRDDLAKITQSVHHEGVAVLAKRKESMPEQELYSILKDDKQPLIVLDEVLNPHNIGSIMRAMAHFGWKYLVCEEGKAAQISGSVARMSEGGSECVEMICYEDQRTFLHNLKSLGYITVGTSTHGTKSLYAMDLKTQSCAFFFGNEIDGLSKQITRQLDLLVAIPSIGEVQSLNVAMASALVIGETMRQRGSKP